MNNTKSPKNVSLKNQLELWLFCALIGAVAGALVWILLKIMAVGTEFLWKWLPGKTTVPYYTILICVAGAAIIGIFRKIFGDYPEDLETVMGKVRTEKRYEYKNMLVMMVAALLPLLIGSSVGPEAGLTGIIVGLCYWAGDNLKFAKQNTRNYSQIGAAVSISVLFHAPLFGIFEVEDARSALVCRVIAPCRRSAVIKEIQHPARRQQVILVVGLHLLQVELAEEGQRTRDAVLDAFVGRPCKICGKIRLAAQLAGIWPRNLSEQRLLDGELVALQPENHLAQLGFPLFFGFPLAFGFLSEPVKNRHLRVLLR